MHVVWCGAGQGAFVCHSTLQSIVNEYLMLLKDCYHMQKEFSVFV